MATKYNSRFTGEQIDNSVETVVSNTATDGQVLTANGTGGATWQDAKGTEVVANPSLAGTESDLTGLEVAGTKYKVPTGGGTEVVANPVLAGTESDLTGLEVAGTKYKVPTGGSGGGSDVEVVQTTGQSTTAVMSQKAVTDALAEKLNATKSAVANVGGLVTPTQAPSVVEIVGIDSTGAQVRIKVDTNDFEIDGTISPYTLKKKEIISDALAGTWVFNDVPILQDASWQLSFNSNGEDFMKVVIEKTALETLEGGIVYKSYNNGTIDKSVIAYGGDGPDVPTEWNNEAYKTIIINSKLSEVTNGNTLLAWLQENATKQ